jgi:Tol biopolymer transport system component
VATRGQLLRSEWARAEHAGYPAGSLGFTWAVIGLAGWLLGGVYLDGWAHIHLPNLETFFTPWHAVLYSGFFALFALLTLTAGRNRGRGYAWRRVLPPGYGLSLAGGFIFLVGGVLDLIWHQIFGIEANTEALLSPTHLILATGIALLVTGPVRAAGPLANDLTRSGMFAGPHVWARRLPPLLGLTFLLALCTFFTQFAHPLADLRAAADSASQPPNGQLYTMRADGTEQTRLIRDPGENAIHPSWSPDGRRLVFTASRDGQPQLAFINADGTGETPLTHGPGKNYTPAWSPDGRWIAFGSTRDSQGDIYVMNIDGSGVTRLTTAGDAAISPAWSPDGRRLTFTANRNGRTEIYVMNTNGSGQTQLTNGGARNYEASWSPDGIHLAFVSERDGRPEVYVMRADGTEPTRLTRAGDGSWMPAWSPDGRRIAFASDRGHDVQVYVMNANGSEAVDLSANPGADTIQTLGWSPDGQRLVFTLVGRSDEPAGLTIDLGLASILLQTTLLIGVTLFALRRWSLPFGTLTLVFGLSGILMAVLHDHEQLIPAAVLAGLFADLLLRWLHPTADRPGALRLFAFAAPLVYESLYFATLALTSGIDWSIHLWAGAAVMAGAVGVLLSTLLAPPESVARPVLSSAS